MINVDGVDIPYTNAAEGGVGFGGAKLTAEEMSEIAAQAVVYGRDYREVAEEYILKKYPEFKKSDARPQEALSFAAVLNWQQANNIRGYSIQDQARMQNEALASVPDEKISEFQSSVFSRFENFEGNARNVARAEYEEIKQRAEALNNKISVSKSSDNSKKDPDITIANKDKSAKVDNPSDSLVRSAMTAVGEAQIASAQSQAKAGSIILDSATNFFQKAMSKVDDVSKATLNAVNKAKEKATDFVTSKIEGAKAALTQMADNISNTAETVSKAVDDFRDKAIDNLSNALLISYDKGTGALKNWLYGDNQPSTVMTDLEAELADIRRHFYTDAEGGMMMAVDDTSLGEFWDEYWTEKWDSITEDELLDLYDQALQEGNEELISYYESLMESYETAFIESNTVGPSSIYSETNYGSRLRNTINQQAELSSDMDNLILQAISKYLPVEYRNVDYLPSIPQDILKSACDQLEAEMKSSQSNELSTDDRERIVNIMWMAAGLGGYHNQLQTFMTSLNRFGGVNVTPSTEHVGLTFITRPRLCLQSSNLRNNRILTSLDTLNNTTMAFAIRCLLDSNFGTANDGLYSHQVSTSPIFDYQNPFLVPLCNALTSFNGSPDIDIESITTDGGYMSEAQSFAVGGSNLQRGNYNLTLNFQEVAHNPILAIMYYWIEYIRCVTRGSLMAYADDIDAQRLNYTVSIYRFLLDPSHRYITKYAKYTGCYPTGLPIGSAFNFSQGDVEVSATKQLSITFSCNKVEYMDYAILMDFNTLMRRYCPIINKATRTETRTRDVTQTVRVPVVRGGQYNPVTGRMDRGGHIEYITRTDVVGQEQYTVQSDVDYSPTDDNGAVNVKDILKCPPLPLEALSNFRGLPYIVSDRNGFRLEFRQHPSPAYPSMTTLADQLLYLDMIHRLSKEMANYESITGFYTPEYAEKANSYKNVDLRDFIRKAFSQKSSSISNDAI